MAPFWRRRRGGDGVFGVRVVVSALLVAELAAGISAAGEGHLEELRSREDPGPSRSIPSAEVYPSSSIRRTVARRGQGTIARGRNLETTSPSPYVAVVVDDEQHPSELETDPVEWTEGEPGRLVPEPPSMAHIHPRNIDRCARWNTRYPRTACGSPLAEPCFDRSRCRRLSVYVYDQECSLADSKYLPNRAHDFDDDQHQSSYWREAVWRAGLLAETYEMACLFVHVNTHNHDEPCATRTPLWNGGANHVMMELTPWWSVSKQRPRITHSFAMDWAFDHHTCFYRSGYDLSLPLKPKHVFPQFESTPATNRNFFLTFKGTLYLDGFGLEERTVASRLDDEPNGIVSVVRCFELHGEHLKPENVDYCASARQRYDAHYYQDLMNTTFALVPAGRSPGTFRLGEVMSAGAIPVFIVRDWVRPFEERVDWPSFSFLFSPDDVGPGMVDALRAVEPDQLLEMQHKSLEAYGKLFGGATNYSVIAETTVQEIISRFTFH